MTGIETAILAAGASSAGAATMGSALTSIGISSAAAAVGSASILPSLGTLATIASLGSTFLGMQGQQQQQQAQVLTDRSQEITDRTNAAIEDANSSNQIIATRRDQYLRTGANIAAAGSSGGLNGSALDILADNATQDELNIIGIRNNQQVIQDAASSRASINKQKSSITKQSNKLTTYSGILSGGVNAYKLYKGM